MTAMRRISAALRRFARDEDGTTLIEFGLVFVLFLLILFGMIDFGRMAFHYVTAERGMYVGARVAAVRPAACPGVPDFHVRGPVSPSTPPPRFGTMCSAGPNVCLNPGTFSCAGNAANPTAVEVWNIVEGTLPNDATIANLRFVYEFDSNLGFLGGPYVPNVTVELQNLTFQFVYPLASFVALAGGAAPAGLGATVTFPSMSVSMPGEDINSGTNG